MTFPSLFARPQGTRETRELLAAYAAGDGGAFEEIVHRFGPLVLACCRRILRDSADAEDAFQATFLVLARKARRVAHPERLAGWLHTVATRTAVEHRAARVSRLKIEGTMRRARSDVSVPASDALPSSEAIAGLDEEIARLPEHYRLPVVHCELQGRSRKAVARELGIAEGTLSSRLAMARRLLAERLRQRGFAAVGLAAILSSTSLARVPAKLVSTAVAGTSSATATQLASGVIKLMFLAKLKALAATGLAVALGTGGLAILPGVGPAAPSAYAADAPKDEPNGAEVKKLIRQLGAPIFTDREAAQKKLKAMGSKILEYVDAGRDDADAEIAERCQALALGFRKELRNEFVQQFKADSKKDPDYPLWQHYKAIAGDGAASRALFAEMIADGARFKRIDEADGDSKMAAEHYANVIAQLGHRGWQNWQPNGKELPPIPTIPEIASALFLGSIDSTANVVPDRGGRRAPAERFGLLGAEFYTKGLRGDAKEPLKKLYGAWLAKRGNDGVAQQGLDRSMAWMIADALPTARRILKDEKAEMKLRISALSVVGRFGSEKADGADVAKLMDDRTVFHRVTINGEIHVSEVRDAAVAVRLHLKGARPLDYGFRAYTGAPYDWAEIPYDGNFNAFPTGFTGKDARNAAHDKAQGVLAKK